MPKIFSNTDKKPTIPTGQIENTCTSSYQEYAAQRIEEPAKFDIIQTMTDAFKRKISTPISNINPDIEMGEYFVIPVSDIKKMLEADSNAEFIHIYNGVRDTVNRLGENKSFPIVLIAPVAKFFHTDGTESYEPCNNEKTIYSEAYPCPPDPHCPKNTIIGTFLKAGTKINNFNSLFLGDAVV